MTKTIINNGHADKDDKEEDNDRHHDIPSEHLSTQNLKEAHKFHINTPETARRTAKVSNVVSEARDRSGKRNCRCHPPKPHAARAAIPTRKRTESKPQGERLQRTPTRPRAPRNKHRTAARTQRARRFHFLHIIWAPNRVPQSRKMHPQKRCAKRTVEKGQQQKICTRTLDSKFFGLLLKAFFFARQSAETSMPRKCRNAKPTKMKCFGKFWPSGLLGPELSPKSF